MTRPLGSTFDKHLLKALSDRTVPEPNSGCLLWTGGIRSGYAVFNYDKQTYVITRVLLGLPRFPANADRKVVLCALHRCDTPSCVNKDHLFVGTIADNNADKKRKGRGKKSNILTHCKQGHPFDGANIGWDVHGRRKCKACCNAAAKISWRRVSPTLLIERAIGKPLTSPAIAHRFGPAIVACHDKAYGLLLYKRHCALMACGNPEWRKCMYCEQYDSRANLAAAKHEVSFFHRSCYNPIREISRSRRRAAGQRVT